MMKPPEPVNWRVTLNRRIRAVAIVLAFWVAAIETRLVYLQVFARADLAARAERQQERTQPSPAKRGDILDRRGHVLATSVDADTIYAVPTAIGDAADAAKRICEALGDCDRKDRQALADRLGQKPRQAFQPIRVAVTGSTISPGLFESLELLGKDETLRRLSAAAARAAA